MKELPFTNKWRRDKLLKSNSKHSQIILKYMKIQAAYGYYKRVKYNCKE